MQRSPKKTQPPKYGDFKKNPKIKREINELNKAIEQARLQKWFANDNPKPKMKLVGKTEVFHKANKGK